MSLEISKDLIAGHIRPLKPIPTGMRPGGRLKRKVTCILFDIYGTLFISGSGDIGASADTKPAHALMAALFDKYGISDDFEVLRQKLVSAVKSEHALSQAKGIDYPEVRIEDVWAGILKDGDKDKMGCFAVEYEALVNPVYPMPHLPQMLSTLKEAGICLGIVSNAQFFTACLFEWFLGKTPANLGFESDLSIFSYQYGVAKPSRILFEKTLPPLKNRNIPVGQVLYLGNDMLKDIYPAAKLGFQTALFAGDKRSLRLRSDDPRCRDLSPDLTITDLRQLLEKILP